MNKEKIEKFKDRLEKLEKGLKSDLSKFAEPNPEIEGDWQTEYPKAEIEGSEDALEDAAKLREEYEVDLGVEYVLELRLKKVKEALERIEKGSYGKCLECGEAISLERLEVVPEAATCVKCKE